MKDRSLIDRLGIEEKHEYLINSLSLYRKISLALIPPLQSSLQYLHGSSDLMEEALDNKYVSNIRAVTPDITQNTTGEDVDVAHPLGEENVLTSFLGMLATALVYAGVDSLKYFHKLLKEKSRKYGVSNKYKLGLIGYTLSESGSDETDSEMLSDDEESLDNTPKQFKSRSDELQHNETDALAPRMESEDLKLHSEFLFAQSLQPKNYTLPALGERTPWQSSVMDNLDLASFSDNDLIQHADKQISDSEEHMNFLKWITGVKLHDAFDLADHDYYHARFSAWLIKDVLLQGQIHVTKHALCFYSLLPGELTDTELNDPDLTVHSGALGHKTGHYGDSYFSSVYTHRFWGVLKPQTLSIYTSPTEQHFPVKVIDLNDASYCEIINTVPPTASPPPELTTPLRMNTSNSETSLSQLASETSSLNEEELSNEDVQSGVWFKIVCTNKTYRFHTGNIYSARHWYNSITKIIFQLHNANNQREVMLKIPINEVLDFNKNFVLSEEFDEPEYDNETPVSFTFKYNTPSSTDGKIEQFKRKAKNSISRSPSHDFVHFLFFQDGADFENLMNLVFEDNITKDANYSLNTQIGLKVKNAAVSGSDSSIYKSRGTFFSTLQPEFSPGVSLADKIALANEKLLAVRNLERQQVTYEEEEFSGKEASYDKKTSMAKIMSIIKRRLGESGTTSPRRTADSQNSMDMQMWASQMSSTLENWEGNLTLHFPKPFSLLTLKSLRMLMHTKRRSFEDIANRFERMSIIRVKNYNRIDDSLNSFEDNSVVGGREDGGHDIELTDSSSNTILSVSRMKRSKLKSLKQSIKTVSTMGGVWSTNPEHYKKVDNEDRFYVNNDYDRQIGVEHFQKHFSLGPDTELVATYFAHLRRSLPVYGKLYLGKERLCFRSLLPGVSTKMILPLKEVDCCEKDKGKSINYSGLHVVTHGEDLVLEFASQKSRNDAFDMITSQLGKLGIDGSRPHHDKLSGATSNDKSIYDPLKQVERLKEESLEIAMSKVRAARLRLLEDRIGTASGIEFPLILEDNPFYLSEIKPSNSYHFTLLTIGSRGDVQPYIALGKGLIAEGHKVTIATHSEFEEWIVKHGIGFKEIAGNPAELMALMVTHGSMSVSFLKEANSKFKGWINALLSSSWKACQGTDILIESPSAMGGIHIAEALGIPYMRAFTMPWTRTRAYPHAFIVPDSKKGGSYNLLTHVMFENVFWKGISGQVNRWRVETLGLPRTSLMNLQQSRIPFLYNISPAMFPPAVDFPDWVKVTGYWFLDEGSGDYEPPSSLVEFIEEAKRNKEKICYIGFGSIVVSDAEKLSKAVAQAVVELGVKCILNKGWSDRLSKSKNHIEVELPPQIYDAGNIPHDWLFSRIDAAVHHGGSGTTGATLRAGLPTIIKPFFGDQFFYASRVEELGVGLSLKTLNTKSLTRALKVVTGEEKYLIKAKAIAQAMQHESGVLTAIAAIYTELAYSKSMILTIKHNTEQRKNYDNKSGFQTPNIEAKALSIVGKLTGNKGDNDLSTADDSLSSEVSYDCNSEEEEECDNGDDS